MVDDKDLGCKIKVIKTDNYKEVFDKISKINQGVAPSEIRKYHHLLKRIVVDSGREGHLKSVLVSPTDLAEIEKMLDSQKDLNKKMVVAMGDSKIIFKIPNKLTYLEDYFFNNKDLTTDVVLRFLANEVPSGRYPFIKYVSLESIGNSNLHDYEKESLRQRLRNQGDLDDQINKISKYYQIKMNDFDKIISGNFTKDREYCIIAYNIRRLNLYKVEEYIQNEVKELILRGESSINTNLRRLFLIFDLFKNKKSDA